MLLDWAQASLDFFSRQPKTASLLHHGDATHCIDLVAPDGHALALSYQLQRTKRRTIGFIVTEQGLTVKAPPWVGSSEIAGALHAKSPWIVRKLREIQTRAEQSAHQTIQWGDGATLQFLGETMTLVLDVTHNTTHRGTQFLAHHDARPPARLLLQLPQGISIQTMKDVTKQWLMQQASNHFTERLNHFAPQLGVQWTRLTLSNAASRWGSAKGDGSIRLHWRLIHFPPDIIDYVVVHELSHLRVMNHSPQFWETVATVMPDHAKRRKHLRTQSLPKWE